MTTPKPTQNRCPPAYWIDAGGDESCSQTASGSLHDEERPSMSEGRGCEVNARCASPQRPARSAQLTSNWLVAGWRTPALGKQRSCERGGQHAQQPHDSPAKECLRDYRGYTPIAL